MASEDGNIVISESWFGEIISTLIAAVKPVLHFVAAVAGSGEVGFAVIFVMFFMIYLVRTGARTGNTGAYADGLRYIGFHGGLVCAIYLLALSAEYLLMPWVALAYHAISNSLSGDEPGLGAFYSFITGPSPYAAQFKQDLADFYRADRLVLPLGFRPAILVTLAFGCMYLVARAMLQGQRAKDR